MKRTDITIQDLEKAIQSLKVEQGDGEAFNAGMYYARDFIEPYYNKLLKENERLNNIIDEMEKFLIDVKQFAYLDKLKELKGSDKDEIK